MTSVVNVKNVRSIGRGIEVGVCADCGSDVRQGRFDKFFKHEVSVVVARHSNGSPLHIRTESFDTCQK